MNVLRALGWDAIGILWGLMLLASFAGWGSLLNRALPGGHRAPLGLRIAWGVALLVAIGGVVSLAHAQSRALAFALVGAGVAFNLSARRWGAREELDLLAVSFRRHPRLSLLLWGALIFCSASTAYCRYLHEFDDHPGYAVFAVRMLQEGTPGDDPFNERRMVSLGGHSFLQSLVWCLAEPNRAALYGKILDPGVGLLAVTAALIAVATLHRSRPLAPVLVLTLVALHPPDPFGNTASTVLHASLIAGLYGTFLWQESLGERSGSVRFGVVLALLCSALVALKSTLVPLAVGLLFTPFAARIIGRRGGWLREASALAVAGVLTAIFLAPWMLLMYRVVGTPLFPLLGRGYHGTSYGTYQAAYAGLTLETMLRRTAAFFADPRILGCWVGGVIGWVAVRRAGARGSEPAFLALFFLVSCLSMLVIYLATNDIDGMRYTYGTRIALLGIALIAATATGRGDRPELSPGNPSTPLLLPMLVLLGGVIGADWVKTLDVYRDRLLNVRDGLTGRPYVSAGRLESYRRAQAAVPKGEPLLAWLSQPFLLDFRRNRIYVLDYPHGASPPPGMPAFRGSEALADYLRGQGIRFILIGNPDEVHLPDYRNFTGPASDVWHRTAGEHALEFYKNADELRRSRVVPFDDGIIAVLDLGRRAPDDRGGRPEQPRSDSGTTRSMERHRHVGSIPPQDRPDGGAESAASGRATGPGG